MNIIPLALKSVVRWSAYIADNLSEQRLQAVSNELESMIVLDNVEAKAQESLMQHLALVRENIHEDSLQTRRMVDVLDVVLSTTDYARHIILEQPFYDLPHFIRTGQMDVSRAFMEFSTTESARIPELALCYQEWTLSLLASAYCVVPKKAVENYLMIDTIAMMGYPLSVPLVYIEERLAAS